MAKNFKRMKIIRIISRILVGCVFIFSGFVKAIDPLGSTYKFSDYFEAFNIGFFEPLSFVLAVLLSTSELVIGINLFLGLRMKVTSWALFIFMSGFTILTLILAINNPVTDCGCFGDALILTNWQTFFKNVILFVPTVVIFLSRKKYISPYSCFTEWLMVILFTLSGILLSIYCYRNLPVMDFRPYKTGTNINEGMSYLEGVPQEVSEIIFTLKNKNTGKEIKVEDRVYSSNSEYWEEGTPWEFVSSSKPKIIKKGYKPLIHDFSLVASNGDDITDKVLADNNYSFLLISYDLAKASKKGFEKAVRIADACDKYGYPFYCMTSSTNEEVQKVINGFNPHFNFYTTDEITLKTIVRSNPGLVLIKNGTVIRKWHYNNFPGPNKLDEYHIVQLKEKYRKRLNKAVSVSFALALLLALGLFHYIISGVYHKK